MYLIVLYAVLLTSFIENTKGTTVRRSPEDLPIKYPGPTQDVDSNRYGSMSPKESDLPEECRGKNFCTVKPANYPQDKIDRMFGETVKKTTGPPAKLAQPSLVIPELADRQGDPDDRDDCNSVVAFEPVYYVKSRQGDVRTVVQSPKHDYIQKIRTETCVEKNSKCFTTFPGSSGFFCKQKYNTWEILVATEDNGSEVIMTELPVCCSCHYKAEIGSRFGVPIQNKNKN